MLAGFKYYTVVFVYEHILCNARGFLYVEPSVMELCAMYPHFGSVWVGSTISDPDYFRHEMRAEI
jgi:hypothetical protein